MKKSLYSLVICENEKAQQDLLLKLINQYANENKIKIETTCFSSAEAFFFNYEENKNVDIILLDIQMEDLDGITMAKQLRAQHDSVQIIFISGYSEHMRDGYQVEAVDYLIKPIHNNDLNKALNRTFKKLQKSIEYILIETENTIQKIDIGIIQTIESAGRNTEWELSNGEMMSVKMGVSEAAERLAAYPQFFQTHRTVIVNYMYVEQFKNDEFIMENEKKIPISRRAMKQAKDGFLQYYLKGDNHL